MSINKKQSFTEYNVESPQRDFPLTFKDYNKGNRDQINVTINGVPAEALGHQVFRKNALTVALEPLVAKGDVRLQRETNIDDPFYKFTSGALFTPANIDQNFQQILHSQQEVRDNFNRLESNTHGVVEAAKEATVRANEAADKVDGVLSSKFSASAVYDHSGLTQQQINDARVQVVQSVLEMLAIKAPKDGDTVYCVSYHSSRNKGGGVFVFDSTKATYNDGGHIINGWVRVGFDKLSVRVSEFGVRFNSSDETLALQRCIAALGNSKSELVFDGDVVFSTLDFGSKRVNIRSDAPSELANQTIRTVSISGAGIVCNSLYVDLVGITFKSTGNKDDGKNICLLTNTRPNGFWLTVESCEAIGFSGHVLYGKDLIDSRIANFQPAQNNLVFKFVKDAWPASTTICFDRVYAQRNNKLFECDDCHHSTMINCIYEYNENLGTISKGSWTLINLYTEYNKAPLLATDTLLIKLKHYAYTATDRIINTQDGIPSLDRGSVDIDPRRLNTHRLITGYNEYRTLNPSFSGQTWTKLGTAALGEAGSLRLNIIGNNGYGQGAPSASAAVGATVVYIQAKNNTNANFANVQATWHHTGNSGGVSEVRLVQTGSNRYVYDVYILQGSEAYLGVSADMVKASDFSWDIKYKQSRPNGDGDGEGNNKTLLIAYNYYAVGVGSGRLGINSNGVPMLQGRSVSATNPTKPFSYLEVEVNGTLRKIPYYD